MDKVTSARNGMGQMAIYLYQAFRDEGFSEEEAKIKVAGEIEAFHKQYVDQAGIEHVLPKHLSQMIRSHYDIVKEAYDKHRNDNAGVRLRFVMNSAQGLLSAVENNAKKG